MSLFRTGPQEFTISSARIFRLPVEGSQLDTPDSSYDDVKTHSETASICHRLKYQTLPFQTKTPASVRFSIPYGCSIELLEGVRGQITKVEENETNRFQSDFRTEKGHLTARFCYGTTFRPFRIAKELATISCLEESRTSRPLTDRDTIVIQARVDKLEQFERAYEIIRGGQHTATYKITYEDRFTDSLSRFSTGRIVAVTLLAAMTATATALYLATPQEE